MRRYKYLLHHPPEILGRRGSVLLCLGVAYVAVGMTVPYNDPPGTFEETLLLHLLLPTPLRVGLWVGFGSAAALCAFGNRWGWDKVGFVALAIMPLERLLSYAWSGFVHLITLGEYGYALAPLGALVWAMVLFLVLTVAGWAEPPRVRTLDDA